MEISISSGSSLFAKVPVYGFLVFKGLKFSQNINFCMLGIFNVFLSSAFFSKSFLYNNSFMEYNDESVIKQFGYSKKKSVQTQVTFCQT